MSYAFECPLLSIAHKSFGPGFLYLGMLARDRFKGDNVIEGKLRGPRLGEGPPRAMQPTSNSVLAPRTVDVLIASFFLPDVT